MPHTDAGGRGSRALLAGLRGLSLIATGLLVAAAVLVAGCSALTVTGVVRLHHELTGSMSPAIEPGDLLVYRPIRGERLRENDVISFVTPGVETPITHRVTSRHHDSGGVTLTTKGDANAGNDLGTLIFRPHDVVWRVAFVIPGAGGYVAALMGGGGLRFGLGLLPLLILVPWARRRLELSLTPG